jgi:hypothetical protein
MSNSAFDQTSDSASDTSDDGSYIHLPDEIWSELSSSQIKELASEGHDNYCIEYDTTDYDIINEKTMCFRIDGIQTFILAPAIIEKTLDFVVNNLLEEGNLKKVTFGASAKYAYEDDEPFVDEFGVLLDHEDDVPDFIDSYVKHHVEANTSNYKHPTIEVFGLLVADSFEWHGRYYPRTEMSGHLWIYTKN